jgi:cytochrome c-type biogenesis protein CcmH
MRRREFIAAASASLVSLSAVAPRPQQATVQTASGQMDQGSHRSVELPPRAGARPSVGEEELKKLEGTFRCQCGCSLDVYTCRTTDFSCAVSPLMHRDMVNLVLGGYSAPEITKVFLDVYGERVLMAPRFLGFNRVGYMAPFVVLVAGVVAVTLWIRRSVARRAASSPGSGVTRADDAVQATDHELQRIARAVDQGESKP